MILVLIMNLLLLTQLIKKNDIKNVQIYLKNVYCSNDDYLFNTLNVITLKCFSMSNRECRVRPAIMNMSSNEPLFCPYSILVNKCSGSCNNINDPFAKLCIHVVKNMNIKLFNLMSRTNEGRHMSWHKTCACKCRLDASVCNNKERCNNDK